MPIIYEKDGKIVKEGSNGCVTCGGIGNNFAVVKEVEDAVVLEALVEVEEDAPVSKKKSKSAKTNEVE